MPNKSPKSAATLRVFLAVELPRDLLHKVQDLQRHLRAIVPQINWVRPESLHLTLKFLGYIGEEMVPRLFHVLEPIFQKHPPIVLQFQGLGVFPHIRRPRIVWTGCTGDVLPLNHLVSCVEAALEHLGFPAEPKPFHPHLTLARIKTDNSQIGHVLGHSGMLEQPHHVGSLTIHQVSLFHSVLHPHGAEYTPLWTAGLAGNA